MFWIFNEDQYVYASDEGFYGIHVVYENKDGSKITDCRGYKNSTTYGFPDVRGNREFCQFEGSQICEIIDEGSSVAFRNNGQTLYRVSGCKHRLIIPNSL